MSLSDIRQICANAEEEQNGREEEASSQEYNLDEYDEEASEEEGDNNDNELSLNDWACAARTYDEPDEDDEEEIIYNEPYPVNENGLQDWASEAGHTRPDECVQDGQCLLRCAATHLVDEEEYVESSKINDVAAEQVAYRQRATKDIVPSRTEDGPRRDFKCLGVIEGYMRINGHKAHVLLNGGSTLDMISANFATVHKLDMFQHIGDAIPTPIRGPAQLRRTWLFQAKGPMVPSTGW